MLRVERRVASGTPTDVVCLPYDLRKKSRVRVRSEGGLEVAITLERGSSLKDGDLLAADSGEILVVRAEAESVSEARSADGLLLMRVAYHLGNRHVPLQIEAGLLRYQHDHVLDEMVTELGVEVSVGAAAFQPEGGAYGGGHGSHSHSHDDSHDHHSHGHAVFRPHSHSHSHHVKGR